MTEIGTNVGMDVVSIFVVDINSVWDIGANVGIDVDDDSDTDTAVGDRLGAGIVGCNVGADTGLSVGIYR